MQKNLTFRNEHKYFCTEIDLALIENKIKDICMPDSHAHEGTYQIRSLYFDTWNLQYYYENESGSDPREKWRIRMYDCNADFLMLECKRKEKGMTQKRACRIDKEAVWAMIRGEWLPDMTESTELIREFYLKMCTKGLVPSTIVAYERVPYALVNKK